MHSADGRGLSLGKKKVLLNYLDLYVVINTHIEFITVI